MASKKKPPAKKKVVKKGLADACEPSRFIGAVEQKLRQAGWISDSPEDQGKEVNVSATVAMPSPLKIAIEKFSVSLVSESMLAMVAMHGILSNSSVSLNVGWQDGVAKEAVLVARAVLAELKKGKGEGE